MYNRTYFINKDIKCIFGDKIVEYDLREAGFSCIKRYKLLPDSVIEKLNKLSKSGRHIAIGKMEIENKELAKNIKECICTSRKNLFEFNNISENKVLSIKNDAVYIIGDTLTNLIFDGLEFRNKREYFAYLYLNKNEFYICDDIVDVKGIKDVLTIQHQDYMLDLMREFSNRMIYSDRNQQLEFIKDVAYMYRNYELDTRYYRELNVSSLFRPKLDINILSTELGYEFYNGDPRELDITYNYMNYLIPLYRLLI